MSNTRIILILLFLCMKGTIAFSQPDLMELAAAQDSTGSQKVSATFKATRLINGHTVETNGAGELLFLISHRFGTLNSGAYHFFGLDQATIRLGLEYGISDDFTFGIGRSSLEKTYDGFLKYRVLQQQTMGMPFSITALTTIGVKTQEWFVPENNYKPAHRLTYTYQFLIARKFSERLSLQLAPTLLHRNLVETPTGENNIWAAGAGGRFKLTKRTSVNVEYFYLLPNTKSEQFHNSLSLGFDIETGGHVFQLMCTNSQGMVEKFFIPQNGGKWSRGDIYFGFNVSRVFQLKNKREEW